MPLPISSIADDRSTALGKAIVGTDRAIWKPDRTASFPACPAISSAPRSSPEVVDHDIHALRELLLETLFEGCLVRHERNRHIRAQRRYALQGVGAAGVAMTFWRPDVWPSGRPADPTRRSRR